MAVALGARSWPASRSLEAAHPGTALQPRRRVDGGQGDPVRGPPPRRCSPPRPPARRPGAVDSFHSSFTALGGGLAIFNMGLGEVAPGGVGSGLYGMLVLAIVTVFVAGLMVGRTPEYLRKKITAREIKLVSLYILTMPVLVLAGTGLAMALPGPKESILNPGPHGLSEVLYAFMSAAQQQRLRLRRALGQHRLLQHRARSGDARRPVRPDRPRARAGRVAGRASSRSPRPPARCPPTARCSSGCSSASSSSSPA